MENICEIKKQAYEAAKEIIEISGATEGDLLVVGCSTSEVAGGVIGKASSPEVAKELFAGIYQAVCEAGIELAAQCCEHLNRALILERKVAKERGYEIVNVMPQPKAGGSFATQTYEGLKDAVAVEHIQADLGIDIGDTLIGMHIKEVAIPVRISVEKIGNAHVVCARRRPKFIGGERAIYNQGLL